MDHIAIFLNRGEKHPGGLNAKVGISKAGPWMHFLVCVPKWYWPLKARNQSNLHYNVNKS